MNPRRVIGGLAAGVLVTSLALAGCSRSNESGGAANAPAGGPAPAYEPQKDAAPDQAAPPAEQSGGGADGNRAPAKVKVADRSLIYTGSVTIRVEDVVRAADRAVDIARTAGGIVGGDRRTLDDGRSSAELVLRVPADKFTATLDELARQLGTEEARAVQTQDVSEEVIDLDARLATQRASVTRVRALMARARTLGEVVSIESELTRREAELASLEQRKAKLADQVALSTITANLHGPDAAAPEEPDTGFLAGLKAGWHGFQTSLNAVVEALGYLLPWLLAIGLPVWFVFWYLRRRRVTPTAAPAPAAASESADAP